MVESPVKKCSSSVFDGSFELLGTLGHGSRSVVYKARTLARPECALPEIVALKVFVDSEKKPQETINRVKREALSLLASRHRNVIRVHDYVADSGCSYLVLEYATHGDLTSLIESEENRLAPERSIYLAVQLLSGLEAIHHVGLIHCDIKPENLLLTEDLTLKISDFSIAVLPTEKHQLTDLAGTFDYLAPECLDGGAVSEATDLYSAAVTFYRLLTGNLPFDGDTIQARINRKMLGERLPLSAFVTYDTERLEEIFARALAADPALRYRTAAEFRRALECLIPRREKRPSSTVLQRNEAAREPEPLVRAEMLPIKPRSHRRHAYLGAAVLSIGLLAGAAVLSSRDIANATLAGTAFDTPFLRRVTLWEGAREALSFGTNGALAQARQLTSGTHGGVLHNLLADGAATPLVIEGLEEQNAFLLTLGLPGWLPQRIVLSPTSHSNELRVSACGIKLSLWISRDHPVEGGTLSGYFREHLSGREGKWELSSRSPS